MLHYKTSMLDPDPDAVPMLRFLGCRYRTQMERTFARQIMKRSSDLHWVGLPGELTRNEARFLAEQNIKRIEMRGEHDFVH